MMTTVKVHDIGNNFPVLEFARWNRRLNDDEVDALLQGVSPLLLPEGLVEFKDVTTVGYLINAVIEVE